ncbi:hypothetical protein PoB_004258800 [Plakobranchus ocellatus]|uniref:Uncharacterized protein n=1 Tax=Plakobranchus ocellatus TaxID=259542 RepID=A0AAV4BA96_9GAST|nr:hypothetical protein PoB_004258800 [Plakobranchus ocellatus]
MKSAEDLKRLIESCSTYPYSPEQPELFSNGAVINMLDQHKRNMAQTAKALASKMSLGQHHNTSTLRITIHRLNQNFCKLKKNTNRNWADLVKFLSSPFIIPQPTEVLGANQPASLVD